MASSLKTTCADLLGYTCIGLLVDVKWEMWTDLPGGLSIKNGSSEKRNIYFKEQKTTVNLLNFYLIMGIKYQHNT